MMGKFKVLIIVVTVLLLSTVTHAGIIYNNGAPDLVNAWASDFDFPSQMADNFSLLPGASVIRDIHWWGVYAIDDFTALDDFTIRIYNNAVGAFLPEASPFYSVNVGAVPRETTGDSLGGIYPVYYYWLDVSPINLTANTTYWLSIVNNTLNDADNWFWATSIPFSGSHVVRSLDGEGWEPANPGAELAFYLTDNAIPEPPTIILLGSGLLGLGFFRRNFRK